MSKSTSSKSLQIMKMSKNIAQLQEQVTWLLEQKQREEERAWSIQALEEARLEKEERERDEAIQRNYYNEYNTSQLNELHLSLEKLSIIIDKKSRIAAKILYRGEKAKKFKIIRILENIREKIQKEYDELLQHFGENYMELEDYTEECYGNGYNKHFRFKI